MALTDREYEILRTKYLLEKCDGLVAKEYKLEIMCGKCIKVLDGDTIDLLFSPKEYIRIRLIGYDAPETHSTNLLEKSAGLKVKKILEDKILNKIVDIEMSPKKDKYGRYLATILYEGQNINKWMIENGYGKPYDGGKKGEWTKSDLEKILM